MMRIVTRRKMVFREEVRQELWSAHLESPAFCLVGGTAESGAVGRRGFLGRREHALKS